jgi:hypothetical protein
MPTGCAIEADVYRSKTGGLVFSYVLRGDALKLRIPESRPDHSARRTDRLWEHTCFEAFLAVPGETAYLEFNFSPSGDWAVYDFSDYRQREKDAPLSRAPRISVQRAPKRLELIAVIDAEDTRRFSGQAQIGLSAVVENAETAVLTYWALRHPAGQPDFHHRDNFLAGNYYAL